MSDFADNASDLEELQRSLALAAQSHAMGLGPKIAARWCQNPYCGDEIPIERRRAVPGAQFCVHCQKLKERGSRL